MVSGSASDSPGAVKHHFLSTYHGPDVRSSGERRLPITWSSLRGEGGCGSPHRVQLFRKRVSSVTELLRVSGKREEGSRLSLRVRDGTGTVSGGRHLTSLTSSFSHEWGESLCWGREVGRTSQQREQTTAKSRHSHRSKHEQCHVTGMGRMRAQVKLDGKWAPDHVTYLVIIFCECHMTLITYVLVQWRLKQ